MDDVLEPFTRLLAGIVDQPADAQMRAIDEAGFCNALRPEAEGGADLSLAEAEPLIFQLGYHAIAAPIAHEMASRALGDQETPSLGLRSVLAAVEIAGAAQRVLDMSLQHAADRVQFGKPIGKQQAVQHHLAVMAEQVLMARMAGQLGCSTDLRPPLEIAASAKYVASVAALQVATLGHAVHGAIGVTQEHRLHRFTAKLHRLRLEFGSENWWAERLGRGPLETSEARALDIVRGFGR